MVVFIVLVLTMMEVFLAEIVALAVIAQVVHAVVAQIIAETLLNVL